MTPNVPTLALISTRAMVVAAEARGVQADDLLAEAGITRSMLADPEARQDITKILRLWDGLRERTGNAALQLYAPTHLPFGSYGVIDYIVDASSTVGAAIHRFARAFRIVANNAVVTADDSGDEPFMGMGIPGGGHVAPVHVDYTFAAVVQRIRMHIRPGLALSRLELARPTPEDPAPYEEVFGAPVAFETGVDRVYFTWEEWKAPTEHGDQFLVKLLEKHAAILAARIPGPQEGIVSEVQRAVLEFLPESPTAGDVARTLHVSTRTLQRKLADEGVTFREVAEDVRSELAKEYLSDEEVPISQVAFMLGFSEQSSFHRAFRRWTGVAPGHWRASES